MSPSVKVRRRDTICPTHRPPSPPRAEGSQPQATLPDPWAKGSSVYKPRAGSLPWAWLGSHGCQPPGSRADVPAGELRRGHGHREAVSPVERRSPTAKVTLHRRKDTFGENDSVVGTTKTVPLDSDRTIRREPSNPEATEMDANRFVCRVFVTKALGTNLKDKQRTRENICNIQTHIYVFITVAIRHPILYVD